MPCEGYLGSLNSYIGLCLERASCINSKQILMTPQFTRPCFPIFSNFLTKPWLLSALCCLQVIFAATTSDSNPYYSTIWVVLARLVGLFLSAGLIEKTGRVRLLQAAAAVQVSSVYLFYRIGSERLIFRPDIWRQDPQLHWYAIGPVPAPSTGLGWGRFSSTGRSSASTEIGWPSTNLHWWRKISTARRAG